MHINDLFGQTLRCVPPNLPTASEKLLVRAGYIHPVSPDGYTFLPLGRKLLRKLEQSIIQELTLAGGQEILTPTAPIILNNERLNPSAAPASVKHPYCFQNPLISLDREINHLVASLPSIDDANGKKGYTLFYQITTTSNSTHLNPRRGKFLNQYLQVECLLVSLDDSINAHNLFRSINRRIAKVCNINISEIDSSLDNRYVELKFITQNAEGELRVHSCESCGYIADESQVRFLNDIPPHENQLDLVSQYTPGCETIESLANYLHIPKSKILKSIFLIAEITKEQGTTEFFIIALLRGDMSISFQKLSNAINASRLRFATDDELSDIGLISGYSSPIGTTLESKSSRYQNKVLIVSDEILPFCPNLVCGANAYETHFLNANYSRDYRGDVLADIVSVGENPVCPYCKGLLSEKTTVEVGFVRAGIGNNAVVNNMPSVQHIINKQGLQFTYAHYDLIQILFALITNNSDENGLTLPYKLAPFNIHLILLDNLKTPMLRDHANQLYQNLVYAGLDVLFDDREVRPGQKFFDADLIGLPIRVTVSDRALSQGGVELKFRNGTEKIIQKYDSIVSYLQNTYDTQA